MDSSNTRFQTVAGTTQQLDESAKVQSTTDVGSKAAAKSEMDAQTPLERHLVKSGKFDELFHWTREALRDSGWRDRIATCSSQYVSDKQRSGTTVNHQELVDYLRPIGRAEVPTEIKAALLEMLGDVANNIFLSPHGDRQNSDKT